METDPILASRILPAGTDGYLVPRIFRVEGGLHYIKANRIPYFSLTYTSHRQGFPNQCYSGGAGHEKILSLFPQFADLAALHLSDINGVPMHAEANGWYQLAGALGGAGERFHVGNSRRNFPATPPPDKPWLDYKHRLPTQDECLQIFANYCRISIDEAAKIRTRVRIAATAAGGRWAEGRIRWGEFCDAMRPRWKAEADAAIAKHNLRVYGDEWEPGSA